MDTDVANRAGLLLDTISIIKEAARALGDFKSIYLDNDEYNSKHIPKKATNDINTIIDELKRDKYDAAHQLEEFKSKYLENINKPIPKKATSGVDTIIHALELIHDKAQTQTASVCSVKYLLKAYDKRSKLEQETDGNTKKVFSFSESMYL